MAIKKPEEMNFSGKNIIIIVSGLPGTGKTTLALSAPDVLLIDADEGMSRVKVEHRKDASICSTYEDVLADIEAANGHYKTIVIDTCGALIDLIKAWVAKDPKYCKRDGQISLQGFGAVKSEFLRLSADLRHNFNVVYLFHESKTKDGDDTFYDLVVEGSTKTLVWQPADLGAHLHIMNGKRYLGFTPTANYNAKSAYGIKGLIEVPELADGDPNDFLTKLFNKVRENLDAESKSLAPKADMYKLAMDIGTGYINALTAADQVAGCIEALGNIQHDLTSKKELAAMLQKKLKALNIVKNKETGEYEQK